MMPAAIAAPASNTKKSKGSAESQCEAEDDGDAEQKASGDEEDEEEEGEGNEGLSQDVEELKTPLIMVSRCVARCQTTDLSQTCHRLATDLPQTCHRLATDLPPPYNTCEPCYSQATNQQHLRGCDDRHARPLDHGDQRAGEDWLQVWHLPPGGAKLCALRGRAQHGHEPDRCFRYVHFDCASHAHMRI